MTRRCTMVKLAKEYLAYRRKLGFALQTVGQLLLQFARYADRSGHRGSLTTELAVRWAKLSRKAPRSHWARRLDAVRGFAKYCAILARRFHRRTFSVWDIAALRPTSTPRRKLLPCWPQPVVCLLGRDSGPIRMPHYSASSRVRVCVCVRPST